MKMRFRDEVLNVTESPLVQIATVAENMPGSLKLCYGESDMPTPEFIIRAAYDAMKAGHTFYTNTAGSQDLREAIARKVFDLHGVTYRPSEVAATVGASMGIFMAIRACVGSGDNAVIISPTYSIFVSCVTMCGGEPRPVPLAREGKHFRLDIDRVRRAINANTRMLIVNSPSNPTGWVISVEEQRALYKIAEQHNLVILADEVYERLTFDAPIAPSFARISGNKDHLVAVNSVSKTYNMTGWRLGWALGSERIIALMSAAAEFVTSNPPSMVQQAAIVALRDGESYVHDLRAHYAKRRVQVMNELSRIAKVSLPEPQGAFYAFPRIEGLTDSTAFTSKLIRETGVAMAPGIAFGDSGEGYVRLCFASTEHTLSQALVRFRDFMERTGRN